jgi:hypothetical protein
MGIAYNTSIVRDGLVLHLDAANVKSYSGSGTVWKDLSGLGGSAVAYNTPTFNTGKFFNFDGASDYFRFDRSDINAGSFAYTNITIDIVILPSSLGDVGGTGNNLFTIENSIELSIGNNGNGFSQLNYASIPWAWRGTSGDVLVNDQWNFISYVHATSGRWLYVNGQQVFYSADNGNLTSGSSAYPYLTLMGRYDGTGSQCEGGVSSVKMYNRALTATEIKQNFEALRGRYGL